MTDVTPFVFFYWSHAVQLPRLIGMAYTRAILTVGAALLVSACVADSATGVVLPGSDAPSVSSAWSLQAIASATPAAPVDVWMGAPLQNAVQVRVLDDRGVAARDAAVRFTLADSLHTTVVARSDADGVVSMDNVVIAVRDTTNVLRVVSAELVDHLASPVTFVMRAWRDVSRFGGDAPFTDAALPVARSAIASILPLGTFGRDDALPSADAILVPQRQDATTVHAMADGLVTEVDRTAGVLTIRVRDNVRVRMAGLVIVPAMWVGRTVRQGDVIGAVDYGTLSAASTVTTGLAIRVIDGAVQRNNFVRPERYGARRSAAFFVRYLADSVRSDAFALVRRAAPDLDGRFDYDRSGRLVGTWFNASSLPALVSEQAAMMSVSTFQATVQSAAEVDPASALGPIALTFAYDAERPGQVRVAAGSALGRVLGVQGAFAVAWEDSDPAAIGVTDGIVRYELFALDDEVRIGRSSQVLLVQMLGHESMRAELVSGNAVESGFSSKAILFVR